MQIGDGQHKEMSNSVSDKTQDSHPTNIVDHSGTFPSKLYVYVVYINL